MKCLAPITVDNPKHKVRPHIEPLKLVVGCGKCEACNMATVCDWAFRLEQESRRSTYAHFVTLTYDPKYVPLTEKNLHTVRKSDVQKYIKRLRKKENGIKYFCAAEYGSRSKRPHYHIIFFNISDPEEFTRCWSINGESIGNCYIGYDCSGSAIKYTLKYMHKKGLIPAFDGDDRDPEFRTMSKNLGKNYLTKSIVKWHIKDWQNRQYVLFKSGHKTRLPRYYREKILEYYDKNRSEFPNAKMQSKYNDANYMIDDNEYLSLDSRIEQKKRMQKQYKLKRAQTGRQKI